MVGGQAGSNSQQLSLKHSAEGKASGRETTDRSGQEPSFAAGLTGAEKKENIAASKMQNRIRSAVIGFRGSQD